MGLRPQILKRPAQNMRKALAAQGYIPLVKIGDAEHWVKDSHITIIYWKGQFPELAKLDGYKYALVSTQ